jgi:branched-chain amino acid transport system ATP-binding protein
LPSSCFRNCARCSDAEPGCVPGGKQKILSLARALAGQPRLLLVDELSLGLAPLVVRRLLETLRAAADQRGMGVLLVEQHARQALQVADRPACSTAGGS